MRGWELKTRAEDTGGYVFALLFSDYLSDVDSLNHPRGSHQTKGGVLPVCKRAFPASKSVVAKNTGFNVRVRLYKTKGNDHIYLYMGNQIKTKLDLKKILKVTLNCLIYVYWVIADVYSEL